VIPKTRRQGVEDERAGRTRLLFHRAVPVHHLVAEHAPHMRFHHAAEAIEAAAEDRGPIS
jgi:hypothetical protein